MYLCIVEMCKNKKAKAKEDSKEAKKAKKTITEEDKRLLDWEKVNALQHVRKDRIAQQEKWESRVIAIEDRCVWRMIFYVYVCYNVFRVQIYWQPVK